MAVQAVSAAVQQSEATPSTSAAEATAVLEGLTARKTAWAEASIDERLNVLAEIRARILDNAVEWAQASSSVRCTADTAATSGDLVATVASATGTIDALTATLKAFKATGRFPTPPTRQTPAGQTVAKVYPWGVRERYTSALGLAGMSVEMYLRPEEEVAGGSGAAASQGAFYREPHAGKVAVVLGAGNQHFLATLDALHMAFVEGCVVALKFHPIQAPTKPFIDYIMEPLARRGFYAGVLCDLDATRALLYSPLTDHVHMTGGTATHDAIVWGAGAEEAAARRAAADPLLKAPMTSELGCVTPWVVAPGPWTEEELTHHARGLAEGVANNVSCNCLAAKVVLLAEGWEQGDALIAAVKQELASYPLPVPYYPGIHSRYEAFRAAYPQAEALAPVGEGAEAARVGPKAESCGASLPWLVNVLPAYPSDPESEYAFNVEPFAPVVTFVKVPAAAGPELVPSFLKAAVKAANDDIWGSLSCTLLVHPATEAAHPEAVQAALDGLRFGSVVVNCWSVVGYLPPQGYWGAFAGDQTLADVGSGLGVVHNSYMYDHAQKSVVRTPFVSSLHPLPPRHAPMPLSTAKVVAGVMHGGLLGALRMAFSRQA